MVKYAKIPWETREIALHNSFKYQKPELYGRGECNCEEMRENPYHHLHSDDCDIFKYKFVLYAHNVEIEIEYDERDNDNPVLYWVVIDADNVYCLRGKHKAHYEKHPRSYPDWAIRKTVGRATVVKGNEISIDELPPIWKHWLWVKRDSIRS